MKKNNPTIPILIREATGIEPKVWARYGMEFGRINFSHADMEKALAKKHPDHCQVHKG
jgi:NADH dehydrogenase (ubiquinone) 1 alpha subcomplex subunit 2